MRAGGYVIHVAVFGIALGCAPEPGDESSSESAIAFGGHARSPLEDGAYDGANTTMIVGLEHGQTALEPDRQVVEVARGTELFCTGLVDVSLLGRATAVPSFEPESRGCASGRILQVGNRLAVEDGVFSVSTNVYGTTRSSLGESVFVRRKNGALSGTYHGVPYTIVIHADTENAFRYRLTAEGEPPREGTAQRKLHHFLDRNTFESTPTEHGVDEIIPGRRNGKFFLSYLGYALERVGD